MTEIDVNLMIVIVVTTITSMYGMSKYMAFKVSENRKQREHLQKQRRTKLQFDYDGKKLSKSGDVEGLLDKFDINSLLEGVEDEDDIDDLPIPAFLKPIAKGLINKFLAGKVGGDEEKEEKRETQG
jgi:hypothetical protein